MTREELRAQTEARGSRRWTDYETAKHYLSMQQWGEPREYAMALRAAADWVGV